MTKIIICAFTLMSAHLCLAGGTALIQNEKLTADPNAERSDEEIQYTFDQGKFSLYSSYAKFLRKNPKLAGEIIFQVDIEVTGEVSDCVVFESSLGEPELEELLCSNIKQFDFGLKKSGERLIIRYPVAFVPS